jgi:hypothetical protein
MPTPVPWRSNVREKSLPGEKNGVTRARDYGGGG